MITDELNPSLLIPAETVNRSTKELAEPVPDALIDDKSVNVLNVLSLAFESTND